MVVMLFMVFAAANTWVDSLISLFQGFWKQSPALLIRSPVLKEMVTSVTIFQKRFISQNPKSMCIYSFCYGQDSGPSCVRPMVLVSPGHNSPYLLPCFAHILLACILLLVTMMGTITEQFEGRIVVCLWTYYVEGRFEY